MENINIEERVAKARQLHKQGYNCSQSVVLAYADLLPIATEHVTNLTAPFGRGISGMRETCGCVTGMAMVCGLLNQPTKVKALCETYRQENGDVNCGRLLQLGANKRTCNDLVASAARMLGTALTQD